MENGLAKVCFNVAVSVPMASVRRGQAVSVKLPEGLVVEVIGRPTRDGDSEELREIIVSEPVEVTMGPEAWLGQLMLLSRPVWAPLRALGPIE